MFFILGEFNHFAWLFVWKRVPICCKTEKWPFLWGANGLLILEERQSDQFIQLNVYYLLPFDPCSDMLILQSLMLYTITYIGYNYCALQWLTLMNSLYQTHYNNTCIILYSEAGWELLLWGLDCLLLVLIVDPVLCLSNAWRLRKLHDVLTCAHVMLCIIRNEVNL